MASKIGRTLAKPLGIKVDYRNEPEPEHFPVGNSNLSGVEQYVEPEPHTSEWFKQFVPNKENTTHYIKSLFPFWSWIFHYNVQWLVGDLIAGVTVGMVVIPQGMAYALLAKLPAEYGLYTSFVGFLLYWAFATSKDITIGTVAVMSTLVGNIVIKVQKTHKDIPAEQIARALSVVCGAVLLFIGLTRLGWIVEFIPLVAITSFMTGAAISIAVGQMPGLLGIAGINTREAAYKVFINFLKGLPNSKLDAAMGLSALFLLYFYKWFCNFMTRKQPHKKKLWFFISTLRMALVILLYTLISFLVNRDIKVASKAKFKILGTVPRGFQHAGAPVMNKRLISSFASELPVALIVLLIEHIAISKSFGRINNYTINPSQELVALGFTNLLGPFLGGYPATGSFSRTAIKSKAGVRTPLAGIFTAVIVLLALYALTSVFFYIPMASLSGLIIHAVGDLITPPDVVFRYWQVSPPEFFIFFAGVFVTLFTDIEKGIYVAIGISAALLLFRQAKSKGQFLGTVKTYTVDLNNRLENSDTGSTQGKKDLFIPYSDSDSHNPKVNAQSPYPGVFIYRFGDGYTYINQARYLDDLTHHIQANTRRTQLDRYEKIGDRPWNDPGPRRGKQINLDDPRPILRAIILDFSSVPNTDVTSVQGLIDVRHQLAGHAYPEIVEWHVANIQGKWTKRALAAAGFGFANPEQVAEEANHKSLVSIAEIVGGSDHHAAPVVHDEESGGVDRISSAQKETGTTHVTASGSKATVYGVNRPFFHPDVETALANVISNIERKKARTPPSEKAVEGA